MLENTAAGLIDINCCDPLGRSALLMGIDNENLEMVELLLDHKVCVGPTLSEGYRGAYLST